MNRAPFPLLLFAVMAATCPPGARAAGPVRGADLSSLPRVEAGGGLFRDADGNPAGALDLLRAGGLEAVRIRLWHSPADGACSLGESLALARRARDAGCDILLDIHYSDTWADPGHQRPPAAWDGLAPGALADSVRAYTRDVVAAFMAQGAAPRWVQVGNEVTGGLLWDAGRVDIADGDEAQWDRLAVLLQAGSTGAREAAGDAPAAAPQVMVHLDRGGDNRGARAFLDRLAARGVCFDAIALSYYPWWHGDLAALRDNLADLAARYGKPVHVVETAYPWTLDWLDDVHNLVGEPSQLLPGLPATPAGQREFLAAVTAAVADVPGGLGGSVFWWEPAWIAAPRHGSPWENLALFGADGRPLPALGLPAAGGRDAGSGAGGAR